MASYYSDFRLDCKKNFKQKLIFFLTNINIELYLQTNTMIQSNHDVIAVRLGDREGGDAGRSGWSGDFTMNEGRKIDCMR